MIFFFFVIFRDTAYRFQALSKILELVIKDLELERRTKKGLDTLANANAMHHNSSSLKHDDSQKNVYEKLHHVSYIRNIFHIIIYSASYPFPYWDSSPTLVRTQPMQLYCEYYRTGFSLLGEFCTSNTMFVQFIIQIQNILFFHYLLYIYAQVLETFDID